MKKILLVLTSVLAFAVMVPAQAASGTTPALPGKFKLCMRPVFSLVTGMTTWKPYFRFTLHDSCID